MRYCRFRFARTALEPSNHSKTKTQLEGCAFFLGCYDWCIPQRNEPMPAQEDEEAVAALLAAAEKMVQAIEASPTLLFGSVVELLYALLHELRAIGGPSDLLDRLLARVAAVRAASVPAGEMKTRIEAARNPGPVLKAPKGPKP